MSVEQAYGGLMCLSSQVCRLLAESLAIC